MARRRPALAAVLLTCSALLLSACGSSASHSKNASASSSPRTITPVAGCENGWTDPNNLAPDRQPARCAPNTPAPKPLATKTTITITAGTLSAEYLGPLRMAIAKGEFAKENLDVQLKQQASTDSLALLAQGKIDAVYSAPEAGMMNAIKQGFDVKWVLGNFSSPAASKSGLWVRLKPGETADNVNLKGATFSTLVGKSSIIMYPLEKVLAAHGAKLTDVNFQQMDPQTAVTAFKNGSVDGAWLLDPTWKDFDNNPQYAFLGGQPLGEPLGGVLYGPSLLEKNRDAGVAFARAMIRTVNTYFAGDYKANPQQLQDLANVLGIPADQLSAVPSEVVDWEIRAGTVLRAQANFIEGKVVQPPALTEDQMVDRSFYAEAVGHQM